MWRDAGMRPAAIGRWLARTVASGGLLGAIASFTGCGAGANQGEIHFADGLERLALGDSATALALLEQANYELDGDPRVLVHIGRLQAAQGTLEARALARETLLDATRRDPSGAAYQAALGELLRDQRFRNASTSAFAAAVRLDPNQARPWFFFGQSLLEKYLDDMEEPALLDSAQKCFERSLALDPSDEESLLRVAFLRMHGGKHEEARALLLPYARRECGREVAMLLTAIDYHLLEFDEAQEMLDAALRCLSDRERESWLGLRPLLHPDSVGAYKMLAAAQRDSVARHYWWSHDPTPTSLVNERLIEHVARAVEADGYFGVPWLELEGRNTDRGEVYMRYGPPSLVRRLHEGERPAWEWRYRTRGRYDAVVGFADISLNGNYKRLNRGAWSDFSEPALMDQQQTQTSLLFTPPDGSWNHVVRQFRGQDGKTALEIAYEFDTEVDLERVDIEVAAWRGPGELLEHSRTSARKGRLYRHGKRFVGRVRVELLPEKQTLGLQLACLEPLRRLAAVAAADSGPSTSLRLVWRGQSRDTLQVHRYDASVLAMSDLLLAHELRDGYGGLFDMGGVIAVPRVGDRIDHEKLHLYFEIYAPERVVSQQTAVVVSYEVRPLPPRTWSFWDQLKPDFQRKMDPNQKPAVEASFTYLPTSDLERQQLTIDLGTLRAGPYMLVVELVDTSTGARTRRQAAFDYAVHASPLD